MRSTVAISRSTSCTWLSSRFSTSRFTDTEHHDTVAFTSMLTSSGCLSASSSSLAEAHRLAAPQLPIAQVVQRLCDDGLVERMRCRHDGLCSGAVAGVAGGRAGLQIQQPARHAQQPEQLYQPGIAQARICAAAMQQGR